MKTESYITVVGETAAEYTEKRSRFIATLKHCETEEEAVEFINALKSKYWDARHNCYAYSVENGALKRFSDDGEPHGTAGKPILSVDRGRGNYKSLYCGYKIFRRGATGAPADLCAPTQRLRQTPRRK